MQNLQICCCITLKESYDPENDEAAPKDVSPNTSLPKRNMHTFRCSAPFSAATPAARWPVQRCHSDGAHCRSERVNCNAMFYTDTTAQKNKRKCDCEFYSTKIRKLDEKNKKLKELYKEQNKKHVEELEKQTEIFYILLKKEKEKMQKN